MYTESDIRNILTPIMKRHNVKKAVLFGSYCKGTANQNSDIDLLVDSGLRGLSFVGLTEDIRTALNLDVDVLDISHIQNGSLIDSEIKATGVTLYEK